MKRVYILKNSQRNKCFYTMVADPREIVKLMPKIDAGDEQENQRPWSQSKVKSIAKYVAGKSDKGLTIGLIPNAPIISIVKPLKIITCDGVLHVDDKTEVIKLHYIDMPDTNAEYEKYSGSINVIDGQHRLLAFREDMRHPEFKDNTPFQMTFTIFEEPAKEEIKQLFIVTNDEQDKVPSNLLRMFKKILGIFDQDDETLYDITKALSDENFSPLYGRIMVGAKRISKGYKEQQISKMLKGSGINKSIFDDVNGDITTVSKVISNYLKAWEKTENVSFGTPGKETITKISGLRYILYMLPSVWQILKDRQIDATADNFEGIIKMLPAATGVVNVFTDEKCKPYFRGESITIDLSREHAKQISYHLKNGHSYNPAANI